MKQEKHVIVDVSTPKNKEEKDKVTKAKIVANLQLGALMSIAVGILNIGDIASNLLINADSFYIVLNALSTVVSGICAYNFFQLHLNIKKVI